MVKMEENEPAFENVRFCLRIRVWVFVAFFFAWLALFKFQIVDIFVHSFSF